jgi:hypothetical protein
MNAVVGRGSVGSFQNGSTSLSLAVATNEATTAQRAATVFSPNAGLIGTLAAILVWISSYGLSLENWTLTTLTSVSLLTSNLSLLGPGNSLLPGLGNLPLTD